MKTPGMGIDTSELWNSDLSALECIYAAHGLKSCCLDFVRPEKLELLREFCSANKLFLCLADYKIKSHCDQSKAGFSNSCERVSHDSPDGIHPVFMSKDRLTAFLANQYYSMGDNVNLAPLLGYPACCAQFYKKHLSHAQNKKMDFILYAVKDTAQHKFYTNRALRYFGASLISHFPCSLDCAASQAIGQERYAFLVQEYPEIGRDFGEKLKSMVFYTEHSGVFYTTKYTMDGDTVHFEDLRGTTTSTDVFKSLLDTGCLTTLSAREIRIGDTIHDQDCGILILTR